MKTCEFEIENGAARMILGSSLDLSVADDLRSCMIEALTVVNTINLDASAVDRIGAASIQVLVSASNTAKHDGGGIKLIAASKTFENGFRDLGLESDLNEWR